MSGLNMYVYMCVYKNVKMYVYKQTNRICGVYAYLLGWEYSTTADHYASISNMYKPVQTQYFEEFLKNVPPAPNVGPYRVLKAIKKNEEKCFYC